MESATVAVLVRRRHYYYLCNQGENVVCDGDDRDDDPRDKQYLYQTGDIVVESE